MSDPIRLVLADDQALIRVGFRLVIEAEDDMVVVAEAHDGESAIAAVDTHRPDVVLMDVRMPGLDGIAATERIARDLPESRVLILTTFDLDEYAIAAIAAGASGFLLKDAQRYELTNAIRAIHRGDAVLAPRATRAVLDHLSARAPRGAAGPDPTQSLTEREREVFFAIARGWTNTEIAERLFLSESTVKTHVSRVLAKTGARDRVHAVILAHQAGYPHETD